MGGLFTQKKGSENILDGRVTVYALVDSDASIPNGLKNPVGDNQNIFAVQADCRIGEKPDDPLNSEINLSIKKGLDQVIKKIKESGIFKELSGKEINDFGNDNDIVHGMAELVPIMAKVVSFNSEEEALEQDGDVYFMGRFSNFQEASMCIQSFSMIYQSRYKEQIKEMAQHEIDIMILEAEHPVDEDETYLTYKGDLKEKLMGTYIPAILYSRKNKEENGKAVQKFRDFMKEYRFQNDVEEIIKVSGEIENNDDKSVKKLSLLLDKIVAFGKEDFNKLTEIQKSLSEL